MDFQTGPGPLLRLDEGSAFDIGDCIVDGVNLAPGDKVPDDGDPRILHAVSGFLFTCGPDHIRHPEPIAGPEPIADHAGRWPLHGSMAGHGGEILAQNKSGECHDVTVRIEIALADGGRAEVRRLWRMNSATGETMLEDTLINIGSQAFVPMWMYHMNIGAGLLGEYTQLRGTMFENGSIGWQFGDEGGGVFCVPVPDEPEHQFARVTLGPISAIGGRSLVVLFDRATLPHLQMWRNQAGHCNVVGIEPVSHPWEKRDKLDAMGLMEPLEPGSMKTFRLGFSFV